jgi:SAM-dependent methyltransferase
MAFQLGTVDFIVKELLPRVKKRGRVVSLARQRITCPPQDLLDYLKTQGFKTDLPEITGLSTLTTRELFPSFGFEHYDDIDFTPQEQCTIVHDMNQPIPPNHHDSYDLVFEMGTMEHIFDVKSTFSNIIKMLKTGGTVFHLSPLTFINHGFYNFSLTLFFDVYRTNGFGNIQLYLLNFPLKWWKNPEVSYQKTDFIPDPITLNIPKGYFGMVGCIADKLEDLGQFRTPIQAFYDPDYPKSEDS